MKYINQQNQRRLYYIVSDLATIVCQPGRGPGLDAVWLQALS